MQGDKDITKLPGGLPRPWFHSPWRGKELTQNSAGHFIPAHYYKVLGLPSWTEPRLQSKERTRYFRSCTCTHVESSI